VAGSGPVSRWVDCSAGSLIKHQVAASRRSRQKHETGDWMHSELDDRRPVISEEGDDSILAAAAAEVSTARLALSAPRSQLDPPPPSFVS